MASDLGQLAEAEDLALRAGQIFEDLGDRPRTISARVTLGTIYARKGQALAGIRVLLEAMTSIDEARDPPRFLLAAQHNLALLYCELGQPQEVLGLLPSLQSLAREVGGDAPVHYRWLEGTVARVQGRWESALKVFFEVRAHFHQRGEFIHYLESSLDALCTYLAMGDWPAVCVLVADSSAECHKLTQDPNVLRTLERLESEAASRSLTEVKIQAARALIARNHKGQQV